jgi:hypothetical protein
MIIRFIKTFEGRGFYVTSNSQSNYMQSALSIATSLHTEYLTSFSKETPDCGQLIGIISISKGKAIFEYFGYKTIAFSSGFQQTELDNSNDYYSFPNIGKSHNWEALLLINSAADISIKNRRLDLPMMKYRTQQERILHTYSSLSDEVPVKIGPNFIFAHIIAPHPSFVFNKDGAITPDAVYL